MPLNHGVRTGQVAERPTRWNASDRAVKPMNGNTNLGRSAHQTDGYRVQIRDDPALDDLGQRSRRGVVALCDLEQMHLSEFGGGRP